jgi:hypothetical protein
MSPKLRLGDIIKLYRTLFYIHNIYIFLTHHDTIYGSIIGISLWGYSHNKLKNAGRFVTWSFLSGRFDLGRNVSYRIVRRFVPRDLSWWDT